MKGDRDGKSAKRSATRKKGGAKHILGCSLQRLVMRDMGLEILLYIVIRDKDRLWYSPGALSQLRKISGTSIKIIS